MEGLQEVINALSIFWVAAIFLLPVSPLRPPRRPFLPYFARTAQRLVQDGKNGLSSSKPCAYCRILWSELKPEVVLATIIRHLHPYSFEWVE